MLDLNIKKFLAGTLLPGMCAVFLLFPIYTQAAEASRATTIVAEVPASHTVKIVIEGQGTVEADGKTYSSTQDIEVGRLKEQSYKITAASGWKLEHVTYGAPGSETEAKLTDSVFIASALYEDGNVLTVTFVKDTSGTGTSPGPDTKPEGSGTSGGQTSAVQNVKTGDETQIAPWASAVVLSLISLILGIQVRRKKIHF